MNVVRHLALLVCLTLGGCAATAPDGPALRIDDDVRGHAELEAAAARLAGATEMRLARDAFRARSELSVSRRDGRTLDGLDDGRIRTRPIALRLERADGDCVLRRLDGGETIPLDFVRCVASDPASADAASADAARADPARADPTRADPTRADP